VRCSLHTDKPGATKGPVAPAPAEAADTRDGNKNKFAWLYDVYADPAVSLKAKVVGPACALKLAGRKGFFKATRKAIANLCGTSHATVRRALDDLTAQKYLTVEKGEGASAANTYHLILPAQRLAQWLDAEKGYERDVASAEHAIRSWLFAENKWRNEHTESLFRKAVFDASIARGADAAKAALIAERLAARVREEGDELEVDLGLAVIASWKDETFAPAVPPAEIVPSGDAPADQKRADPGSTVSRPRLNGEPTPAQRRADPGSMVSRPRLTPDADTSGDDETHKSFKDSERPVKVFQDSESEPALRGALTRPLRPVRSGVGDCDLCDTDGRFLHADGELIDGVVVRGLVFLAEYFDNDERWIEHPLVCQHSIAGNLAEIQRREKTEDVELFRTGWPEIDVHYPLFTDD
jgi:hypothetical protein